MVSCILIVWYSQQTNLHCTYSLLIKTSMSATNLQLILTTQLGWEHALQLSNMLHIPASTLRPCSGHISRIEITQALNMLLFEKLLKIVPQGEQYVQDTVHAGNKICFDHGALRTVLGKNTGALPTGEAAFIRILHPLGYRLNGIYPLSRISMTGRAYVHIDDPEEIAQFFLSELHPEQFSAEFQRTVDTVLATSRDPLDAHSAHLLQQLSHHQSLTLTDVLALLPVLIACFDRQHALPSTQQYQALRSESAEMAWISTEGNTFNHATDRVQNVEQVADIQRTLGRSIKEKIEISRNGRVRQTAFLAHTVTRMLRDENNYLVEMKVPGSFYEFISRDYYLDDKTQTKHLDLTFDSSNAQGIFKMTTTT